MAERIETVMARGTAEVHHNGDTITINLPEWFKVPEDVWYDEDRMVEWCKERGILLASLHKAWEQWIIKIRAVARPADLPPAEKGGNPIKQLITPKGAQERVDSFKPEPRKRPEPLKGAKSEEEQARDMQSAIKKLLARGFDLDAILSMDESELAANLK